ncbi:MAG TPA: hypothetical protein VFN09_00520 [Rhodanobacteraceae bacterium]|nr:hypothetical protein [Rhodanobacteraceae bacterium]
MAHDSRQGRRGAWRVVIVSLGLAVAVVAAWGQPLQLDARTLSDQAFQIPGDLASGPAVLVVGFTKAAQKQTTAWSRQLTDLDKVSVYEVAILEDVPTLIRRFVIGSIKSAVPKALHDHFLSKKRLPLPSASWAMMVLHHNRQQQRKSP